MRSYCAVLLGLLLVGCGGDSPEEPIETTVNGFAVRVESSPARLEVRAPDGRVLIDGLPGGVAGEKYQAPLVAAATRTNTATYEFQVGSFKIEETQVEPWNGVTEFRDLRVEGGEVKFTLENDDGDATGAAVISAGAEGELKINITASGTRNRASLAFACDPDEHFLGFGGQTADSDHRGQTVPLWVSEDGIGKAPVDSYDWGVWFLMGRLHSTHTPMPMYVSSRGYGMILDTPYRSIFAMCSEEGEHQAVRIETWEPEMRLHLFDGPTTANVMERMTSHVGRPKLPPAFAFAPWLDAIYGSANVRRVAQKLRTEGVPSSVIWSEDWRGANDEGLGYVLEEDWEVDRDLYPDFEQVADDLHDLGFKFLIYNNTFLDSRVPAFDEAVAGGHTIKDANGDPYMFTGVKFEPTTLLDLSNPAAVAWAKSKYRAGLELGADGYMADFCEWLPTDAVLASGEDALARHNLYPVDYARLNRELFDEMHAEDGVERLFFMRAAYMGSQPLVSVVWAGDQQTDFTEDDGIASVIPMGIGLGMTGFPFFGHDIAGYMSQGTDTVTKELWFRWVTFGALSPVMRTHHGRSARQNWHWESDAESTAHMKRWTTIHMRLFPYLYGMAKEAVDTGLPMFRPLALRYPSYAPAWTSKSQFMLGDRIIVAPVVTKGATSRKVALPEGSYYPLLGGARIDVAAGGAEVDIDAPLSEIPALVPAGTVLVWLPDGVDTAAPAGASSGVTTLQDVGDNREVWVWAGGQSSFTEVSGLAYAWDSGTWDGAVTAVTWNGQAVTVMSDADGSYVDVTGEGTLAFDGGATLVVTGGDSGRSIRARFR